MVQLYQEDPAKAVAYLTNKTYMNLEAVEKGWWEFAWHLMGKYYDGGMINEAGKQLAPGYSTEYLKQVDFGGTWIRDQQAKPGK